MFEMDPRAVFVEQQRKPLKELAAEDISFVAKKGEEAGFAELQRGKQALCAYFEQILDLMDNAELLGNLSLEQLGRQTIANTISTMQSWRSNATAYASQQVEQNYFNRRSQLLGEANAATEKAFRELAGFEAALRIQRLQGNGDLSDKRRELDLLLAETKTAETTFRDLQEKVRDQVAGFTKDQAAKRFRHLADGHRHSEWIWLTLLVLVCGVLGWSVWGTVHAGHSSHALDVVADSAGSIVQRATAEVLDEAWRRLLLLSSLALGVRIVLARYRDERSLRILYDHRATVLTQYEQFDAAIGDDVAKNQFRLEMARIIFSDPATSADTHGSGSEINISPAISAIEKLTGKSG